MIIYVVFSTVKEKKNSPSLAFSMIDYVVKRLATVLNTLAYCGQRYIIIFSFHDFSWSLTRFCTEFSYRCDIWRREGVDAVLDVLAEVGLVAHDVGRVTVLLDILKRGVPTLIV